MNAIRPCIISLSAAALLSITLAGVAAEAIDETVLALRNLDQSVASNQLDQAEKQLQALQQRIPGDTRLEQAQREISASYLRQGESALQSGNLPAATQALQQAQRVMPVGNAQASALASAIQQTEEQQAAALAAQQAAEAQAAQEKAEQARQQKLAAERKAEEARKAAQAVAPATAAGATEAPKAAVAQLIDPLAASSTIALPMLADKDSDALRDLLDKVAADVVAFNCKVSIGVQQGKDYPWVAALLSARVKKLDPAFELQAAQVIDPAKEPELVLSPQS
ncbi:hypothetical protein [Pseudomonas sp. N040]|uniref:hypothetical protein n=1 Tax=Pseudomonas sp. N040 TaxID=2785325 RepID=UPI0018A2BCFB|nr:hypothetical protein [Pseudomonas sp. N040]MBF7728824.1 hypothetical protein [Pseudomonas sp. N040]MBW7012464.1 hypothetical protein [Pseudomonas sp. N040]